MGIKTFKTQDQAVAYIDCMDIKELDKIQARKTIDTNYLAKINGLVLIVDKYNILD